MTSMKLRMVEGAPRRASLAARVRKADSAVRALWLSLDPMTRWQLIALRGRIENVRVLDIARLMGRVEVVR